MRRSTRTAPLVLLAALLGLLALLMQPSPARAASLKTRVGASTSFAAPRVGVATAETPALQPGNNATYDGVTSGDLFAADSELSIASSAGGARLPFTETRVLSGSGNYDDLINEMKAQTNLTGNEHALVQYPNGDIALGSGGPGGITDLPGDVFLHTHPTIAGPSAEDFAAAASQEGGMYVLHGGEITYLPGFGW